MYVTIEKDIEVSDVYDMLDDKDKQELTDWLVEDMIAIPHLFEKLLKMNDREFEESLMDISVQDIDQMRIRLSELFDDEKQQ